MYGGLSCRNDTKQKMYQTLVEGIILYILIPATLKNNGNG